MKKHLGKIALLLELLILLFLIVFIFEIPFGLIGIIITTILFSIHLKKYTKHNVAITLFILIIFFWISPILMMVYTNWTYCDFIKKEVLKADNGYTFDFAKGKINYIDGGGGFMGGSCRATFSFNPEMRSQISQMGSYWNIEDDCIDYLTENHFMPTIERFLREDPLARMPSRCAVHIDIKDENKKDELIIYDLDRHKLFYKYSMR